MKLSKYLNNKYNQGQNNLTEILQTDYNVIDWRQSDFRLYLEKKPRTLRTGRHGILYTKNGKLRKLSGYEALLLQGFPKEIAQKVIEHKLPDSKVFIPSWKCNDGDGYSEISGSIIKIDRKHIER